MIKGQKEDHTRVKMQGSDQRMNGEDEGSDREVFGRERCAFLLREIEEK